jgi:hypothetical protein
VIAENFNFSVFGNTKNDQPKLSRIDIAEGFRGCKIIWSNTEIASASGANVSTCNGLVYHYDLKQDTWLVSAQCLTAMDLRSGDLL